MSFYQDYSLQELISKVAVTDDEIDLHIELIKRYVKSDKLEAAAHQCNLTDALMPNDVVVLSLKAFCLINLGLVEEGTALFEAVTRQNANCEFQALVLNEISPLFQGDMYGMTREQYIQAKIDNAPEGQKRTLERAKSFLPIEESLQSGDLENAVDLLLVHLVEYPDDLNAEMGLAGVYQMMGQRELAEKYYRNVINADPSSASAYFGLAMVVEDVNAAIEASQRGLELTPGNHCERYNLGVYFIQADQIESARNQWSRIPADDPFYPYAMCGISECYERQGDLEQAIEYSQKAVAIGGQDPELHTRLGSLQLLQGSSQQGMESLERAVEMDPTSIPILLVYARALEQLGQPELAISKLEEAYQDAPNDFDLNHQLGVYYHGQEDYESCIEHSLRAIEANCDAYASYWNAAVSYARLNDRDACLSYLALAIERNPEASQRILSDDDLAPFSEDPEFQALAQSTNG